MDTANPIRCAHDLEVYRYEYACEALGWLWSAYDDVDVESDVYRISFHSKILRSLVVIVRGGRPSYRYRHTAVTCCMSACNGNVPVRPHAHTYVHKTPTSIECPPWIQSSTWKIKWWRALQRYSFISDPGYRWVDVEQPLLFVDPKIQSWTRHWYLPYVVKPLCHRSINLVFAFASYCSCSRIELVRLGRAGKQ